MVVGVESNITTKQQQNWPRFDSTPITIEIITTKQQQNWPRFDSTPTVNFVVVL
jgi:hypothetical protein